VKMGTFTTKLRVSNLYAPARSQELELLVDTGAAYSWISRSRLEALGIVPIRRMRFRMIDGRIIERDLAAASVTVDSYTGPDTIVMGDAGDLEVLGAHSIEGLGLAADPVQHKLVPTIGLALRAAQPSGTWLKEIKNRGD